MKAFLTTLGVTLSLAAGPCLAADSFTPEGAPVYSVTAKGKDSAAAGGNARVAALRSAMKEMAGDDFVKAHSKEIRSQVILRYQDFTGAPLNAAAGKSGKLVEMKADVAVDARRLADALSAMGAEVVLPEPPKDTIAAASGDGTPENPETPANTDTPESPDTVAVIAAGTDASTGAPDIEALAADGNDGFGWLRSAGVTWQGTSANENGASVLTGVTFENKSDDTTVKYAAERLILNDVVAGAASEPVTVGSARFEALTVTAETDSDVTVIRAPFMDVRNCRLVPDTTNGRTTYLPESSTAKGNPEIAIADITAEVRTKSNADAAPTVITIKSASNNPGESGQNGSIAGVSVDDGDGLTASLGEISWNGLHVPSTPELKALAADEAALDKAVGRTAEAASHGGALELKNFSMSYAGITMNVGGLTFTMSPVDNDGSRFRIAISNLEVPPALIDMIPDIPTDIVKGVLPEGDTLGFSLEGSIVPGKTSKAPSTLKASLTSTNLCDLNVEAGLLLDADSFAELDGGSAFGTLMGTAGRISVTKASASLADRKALGLLLAVGGKFMQSTPSQLLPQLSSMMQSMKPEQPKDGTERIIAELIGAVQPVLATLGGLNVSLEFPTPVQLAAPAIPDDVMITTSVSGRATPVLESLPENLR